MQATPAMIANAIPIVETFLATHHLRVQCTHHRQGLAQQSESSEVCMVHVDLGRRAFVEALIAFPLGGAALSRQAPGAPAVKVAAGSVACE